MSRRVKISLICLAILVGVAIASFRAFEVWFLLFGVSAGIILYILGHKFFVILVVIFLAGFAWFFAYALLKTGSISSFDGKEVAAIGKVTMLSHDGFSSEGSLRVAKIQDHGEWKRGSGIVHVRNNSFNGVEVGDMVQIAGNFSKPVDAKQLQYNFSKDISGDLSVIDVTKIRTSLFGWMQKLLARLHDFCLQKLTAVFSPPVDAMLGALLLGARTEVPKSITDAFKQTGTTHILALSGYNISIIFSTIELFLAKLLRPKIRFLVSAGLITAFVFLVGLSSSVVRAAVMGILAGMSARSSRITSGVTTLLLASTIMVVLDPKILAFDVSFQLSALATFGIMAFEKNVEAAIGFVPNIMQAREILATTISAQIPTIPILIYTFHNLSTLSLLANILVLPLVPLIMASGFANLLVALFSISLGKLFSPVASFLVNLMDGTLQVLSQWHFALLQLRIPVVVLVAYSVMVVAAFLYKERKNLWL